MLKFFFFFFLNSSRLLDWGDTGTSTIAYWYPYCTVHWTTVNTGRALSFHTFFKV